MHLLTFSFYVSIFINAYSTAASLKLRVNKETKVSTVKALLSDMHGD
jgi:hypothetical protein